MKRRMGLIIALIIAAFIIWSVSCFTLKTGAFSETIAAGYPQPIFTKVELASPNNTLTKYSSSVKALEVLKATYGGHHFAQSAEYSAKDKAWFVTAGDMNFDAFCAKVTQSAVPGGKYYVVLPDESKFAYVLGMK